MEKYVKIKVVATDEVDRRLGLHEGAVFSAYRIPGFYVVEHAGTTKYYLSEHQVVEIPDTEENTHESETY